MELGVGVGVGLGGAVVGEKHAIQSLKIEEIIEFINKLGYKVDKNMIESNDSDVIIELYCSLLEKLGVVKKDKLKISFAGIELFSYTGLHDRIIYILKFFSIIKKFMIEVIGIENFNSSDLFTPNLKKTKRILTGLIKYYRFKNSETNTYNNFKENVENSKFILRENFIKYERIKANYIKIKELKDKEHPLVRECDETIINMSLAIVDLQSKIKESEIIEKNNIREFEEIEEKIVNIDSLNESLCNKINSLKGQIVNSPEKLQLLIDEHKSNIEVLTITIQDLTDIIKQKEKQIANFEFFLKIHNEYLNLLTELEKLMNNLNLIENTIYEVKDTRNKKEKIISEINLKIDNLRKTLANLVEYSNDFSNNQKKALESKDGLIMQIKEKNQILNKKLNEMNEHLKNQMAKNKLLMDNIDETQKIKEEFYVHIENEMNILLGVVLQYCLKLNTILDNAAKI